MSKSRVIGSEFVEQTRARGLNFLEVFPGDIVTAVAKETAARINIEFHDGPIEKPAPLRTDGNTATRRALYRRAPKWIAPKAVVNTRAQRFSKISIIGSGGVGTNLAHLAANHHLAAEITLIDIVPGLAAANALDLNHCSGITNTAARVTGSENLEDVSGSHVVVVTAGRARTPGMTRTDLVNTNKRVIRQVGNVLKTQAPDAIVIVVTNPLDDMTLEMVRCTGFDRNKVIGMAGTLDSSRFRHALAKAAGVSVADVSAVALGNHGDDMVPVTSTATVRGRSLESYLNEEAIAACVDDAITGGGQVVALKKSGSAVFAPAHAVIELLDHIRGAKAGSIPVSVLLNGEYGINGVVLGVPTHLGINGVIEIEELDLSNTEVEALLKAAAAIQARLAAS